ncbi:MAG TPA: class I SAM-dependent methyltransferase [Chitinophagaceae bacterium]|nr:class I SAM-dependent methyltransferase [Chitinophagaceae bacterium]
MAKDLFSGHAQTYNQFRPHYPHALYKYILSFVVEKDKAWDCATGNGQAAMELVNYFNKVVASDISKAQIDQAKQHPKIEYVVGSAENTPFSSDSFDLITVAQAFHWFDHNLFAKEVQRVGKKDGVVAVWLYDRFTTNDEAFDNLMDDFYFNVTGPYWEKERAYVDEHYNGLHFPFELLPAQNFETVNYWTKDQLIGYLTSWSAVQKYIKIHGVSPVTIIKEKIHSLWGTESEKKIIFPIYLQLGRIKK